MINYMGLIFPFIFGILFGFVIQRGLLCNYEALTDALIIKNYQKLRIILWALLTAMIGFHVLASLGYLTLVSSPFFLLGTIFGSIIVGIGIVLIGSCISGMLLRAGMGMVNYFIVFFGLLSGLFIGRTIASHNLQMHSSTLASFFNLNSWVIVIIFSFLLIWFLYKHRPEVPEIKENKESLNERIFKKRWPSAITGIAIGVLTIFGFARWEILSLPTFFKNTSSFNIILTQLHSFLWIMSQMIGILIGVLISAIIAGEFGRGLFNRGFKKSLSMFIGGLLIGIGTVLTNGCFSIHLFVLTPQLSMGSLLSIIIIFATVWLATIYNLRRHGIKTC